MRDNPISTQTHKSLRSQQLLAVTSGTWCHQCGTLPQSSTHAATTSCFSHTHTANHSSHQSGTNCNQQGSHCCHCRLQLPRRSLKRFEEMYTHYIERIRIGGWEEEMFMSALNIADQSKSAWEKGRLISPQVRPWHCTLGLWPYVNACPQHLLGCCVWDLPMHHLLVIHVSFSHCVLAHAYPATWCCSVWC